jgi:hypothetical protein
MALHDEKNTQDHVSVFNKFIYACHANGKPKTMPRKKFKRKTWVWKCKWFYMVCYIIIYVYNNNTKSNHTINFMSDK